MKRILITAVSLCLTLTVLVIAGHHLSARTQYRHEPSLLYQYKRNGPPVPIVRRAARMAIG